MKNFRPVSNLSYLSKLIEKVVAISFVEHMRQNATMEKFQSAYKAHHITETALLRVYNDVMFNIDRGNGTLLVLLNLSAAFDTTDHQILFHILEHSLCITGCCCLPTPMTLASGGSPMFPLVVHQPASPSIWPAVQSLRRGLTTHPEVTMGCVCGCS